MPIMLREPAMSAACDPQNSRCSFPGDKDSGHDETTTSKSQLRSRFSYWVGSMVRTLTAMPSRSSDGLKNSITRSKLGSSPNSSSANCVPLLEIERKIQRAAYPRISELVAAGVQGERLHDAGAAIGKFLQQHALFGDGWKIVGRGPVFRAVLGAPIHLVALESLERHGRIAKVLIAQFVEVIAPYIDVEVASPVILHPLQRDRTPRHEFPNAVVA